MNLRLIRNQHFKDHVFGVLIDERQNQLCFTLEPKFNGEIKLDPGTYTCKRGPHRLKGMEEDFETFEIMDVPGNTGILIHVGNYPRNSEGCVLIGLSIGFQEDMKSKMLTYSKQAFEAFMKLQDGVDEFELKVEDDK